MNFHSAFKATQPGVELSSGPGPAEPTPLLRSVPPAEPYPIAALGPLRAAAEAIHDMTQAPAAVAAQSVLGVASLAVQALADVETLHGQAPASLFLVTVAQSGERKSACDRLAMKSVREFEAELAERHREDAMAYRNRLDLWQEQRKAILKEAKKDPGGARADLDALGPEPEGPLYPAIVSAEPTVEGITKHMARLRPALGLFSDEGGAFVGGHGMNRDNRLKTVATVSRLWDGTAVDRWRAGEGVALYQGRRLSAHLMIQPIAATGLLADPLANGQGFLARFLMTEPPSAIGTRLRIGHDAVSDAALSSFSVRVGTLLRRQLPLRDGSRNELEPRLLELSEDARALLRRFSLSVEQAQAKGGDLETVRPFASKAAEHAARLAGVLALFDNPDAKSVSGSAMADALTLVGHYIEEARRLSDAAVISTETTEAEKLRVWLMENWPHAHISAADAAQHGPNSLRETVKVRKLLGVLATNGWVHPVEGGAVIDGKRRREAWRVGGRVI